MNRFVQTISVGLLAFVSGPAMLRAQELRPRSGAEWQRWRADERQAPRYVERATHLGFEVSQGPILVIAKTSMEDARQAAEQATSGWQEMARLVNRFDSAKRRPPFALASLQIVVDDEPPPARWRVPAEGSVVAQTTQMGIQIGSGQPSLDAQRGRLRQTAAQAYLHAAALDRQLPSWVCEGLAAYVSGVGAGKQEGASGVGKTPSVPYPLTPFHAHTRTPFYSPSQQRLANASPIDSDAAAENPEAAELVRFLIEGDDARNAGPFFGLLAEQLASGPSQPDQQLRPRNEAEAPAQSQALDQFVQHLATEFEHWKANPNIGQPALTDEESADGNLRREQQEMLFTLKLFDRFARAESAAIRTRVTMFDKGQRAAIVLTGTAGARPPSVLALLEQMTAHDQAPWATVGPDGTLIWNTDVDRLREILGVDQNRYQHVWHSDRWVLQTRLADDRQLRGWLEANPKDPRRPLGRIEVQTLIKHLH